MKHMQKFAPHRDNELNLVELSVVLVANSNNPSIINPDFLRYNKIVNDDYEVQDSPITTPAFSQVTYKNGITVVSAPDRVIFKHSGAQEVKNVESPEIAKRYLKCIPHIPYRAIGINPKGFKSGQEPKTVLDMLHNKGSWMSFKDVIPKVQLKAMYRYNERTITMGVSVAELTENSKTTSGTMYEANIHRELTGVDASSRIECLNSILNSWERDLEDFYNLSNKFHQER